VLPTAAARRRLAPLKSRSSWPGFREMGTLHRSAGLSLRATQRGAPREGPHPPASFSRHGGRKGMARSQTELPDRGPGPVVATFQSTSAARYCHIRR